MTVRAVVYSDDSTFVRYVIDSIGAATVTPYPTLIELIAAGSVDLVILDGDATPAGGLDVARHLKDQFVNCPPILLVVARAADAWLALCSKADATAGPGRNPLALLRAVSRLRPAASRSGP